MSRKKSSQKKSPRKWSSEVTEHSDALDLKHDLFKGNGAQIARSLKKAAEESRRRKSSPYQSAMSMLSFYVNRAGKNLSSAGKKRMATAKTELRALFNKPPQVKTKRSNAG